MTDPFDYERFFMLTSEFQCVAGTDSFFKRVNPAFTRHLGWSEEKLLERPFTELVHPDDVRATTEEVESLEEGLPTISFINRYRCKDRSYRKLRWTAFTDRASGLIYAVARDVTDEPELSTGR